MKAFLAYLAANAVLATILFGGGLTAGTLVNWKVSEAIFPNSGAVFQQKYGVDGKVAFLAAVEFFIVLPAAIGFTGGSLVASNLVLGLLAGNTGNKNK